MNDLNKKVNAAARRKIAAQENTQGVWFGLGMSGLIGWSVVVPTLLGTACGIWLDGQHPGLHSWTLMLLSVGLAIGCLNAWHWVAVEGKSMQEMKDEAVKEEDENDDD